MKGLLSCTQYSLGCQRKVSGNWMVWSGKQNHNGLGEWKESTRTLPPSPFGGTPPWLPKYVSHINNAYVTHINNQADLRHPPACRTRFLAAGCLDRLASRPLTLHLSGFWLAGYFRVFRTGKCFFSFCLALHWTTPLPCPPEESDDYNHPHLYFNMSLIASSQVKQQ